MADQPQLFQTLFSIRTAMITDHYSYRLSINGKISNSAYFDAEVFLS